MQQVQTGTDNHVARNLRGRVRTAQTAHQKTRQEPRPEVLPEVIYDHTRAELFSRYQEILDESRETGATVRILQDGAEELVLMSPETFQRYAVMELESLLAVAEEDEREGRFSPLDEVFARLEEDMKNGTL